MKILVACEESQAICKAFRANGHEAYSCDIKPCSGGHPEWHIQDDVMKYINLKWDILIAHPPCTYLTVAGANQLFTNGTVNKTRYIEAYNAKQFFLKFLNAPCEHILVENPQTMRKYLGLPMYSQIIHPWMFGDPYYKRTCLWLKNLPLLIPEYTTPPPGAIKFMDNPEFNLGGGGLSGRAERRSKTFPGIARAIANQYNDLKQAEYQLRLSI